jgi:hypothetical protein
MARTYLTGGDNSRGGSVTGANAKFAHLRGWNAGVEVNVGRTEDDRDCFYVNMTGGSNGYSQKNGHRHPGRSQVGTEPRQGCRT